MQNSVNVAMDVKIASECLYKEDQLIHRPHMWLNDDGHADKSSNVNIESRKSSINGYNAAKIITAAPLIYSVLRTNACKFPKPRALPK